MVDSLKPIYFHHIGVFIKTKTLYAYFYKNSEEPSDMVQQAFKLGAPLDEFIATPLANVNAIEDAMGNKFYDGINNSPHAYACYGVLSIAAGLILVIQPLLLWYRKQCDREQKSHFFYIRRLLQSKQSEKEKKDLEEIGKFLYGNDILIAAAYFYSSDVSKLIRWKRRSRFFCSKKKWKEYVFLKEFLTKKSLENQQTEEEILKAIFIDGIEWLVKYLNKKIPNLECGNKFQHREGTYLIGFSEQYSKAFFSASRDFLIPSRDREKLSYIKIIISTIAEASFFYWLLMFIFYFITAGGLVVGGIAFPPLALAVFFLVLRSICRIYQRANSVHKKIDWPYSYTDEVVTLEKVTMERHSVELNKKSVFVKASLTHIKLKSFRDSQVYKDLHKVLGKRSFMRAHAVMSGFIEGALLAFFGIWLFNDLFKLLAGWAIGGVITAPTASPVFGVIITLIAVAAIVLGLCGGYKKARKALAETEERYKNLECNIELLEKLEDSKIQIRDLSLYEYDHVLRYYRIEPPKAVKIKKRLNQMWVILKRLGTGSLSFRLLLWSSLTSFVTIPAALILPISVPFIVLSALTFAVWYSYAYKVEREWKQAGNVMNHLCLSSTEKDLDRELFVNRAPFDSVTPAVLLINKHNSDSHPNLMCMVPDVKKTDNSLKAIKQGPVKPFILDEKNDCDKTANAKKFEFRAAVRIRSLSESHSEDGRQRKKDELGEMSNSAKKNMKDMRIGIFNNKLQLRSSVDMAKDPSSDCPLTYKTT